MRHLMLLCLLVLVGCNVSSEIQEPGVADVNPTNGWIDVAKGVRYQSVAVEPPYSSFGFQLSMVQIDPSAVDFRVHYQPRFFYSLSEWQAQLNNPVVIVNANFFTSEGFVTGLAYVDGQGFGSSYTGFGGMFQVGDGVARVRSLVQEPYAGEVYDQAAQGFPMFVEPGGRAASTGAGFDDPSRRTFVAQDTAGKIYFMVAPGSMTLRNVQAWLLASDLNIDVAFGLDGGKSSGMFVADDIRVPSIDGVPMVIAVYER